MIFTIFCIRSVIKGIFTSFLPTKSALGQPLQTSGPKYTNASDIQCVLKMPDNKIDLLLSQLQQNSATYTLDTESESS